MRSRMSLGNGATPREFSAKVIDSSGADPAFVKRLGVQQAPILLFPWRRYLARLSRALRG